jgi:hypothetical protein
MGGRMTSMAASEESLPSTRTGVFGFPLHPAGQPSTSRGEHLARIRVPMLFLQGTRDKLAELALLRPICTQLRKSRRVERCRSRIIPSTFSRVQVGTILKFSLSFRSRRRIPIGVTSGMRTKKFGPQWVQCR